MKSSEQVFSTSYGLTPEGGLEFVVATVEQGEVFRMQLDQQEALNNLLAFAATLGLQVVQPL